MNTYAQLNFAEQSNTSVLSSRNIDPSKYLYSSPPKLGSVKGDRFLINNFVNISLITNDDNDVSFEKADYDVLNKTINVLLDGKTFYIKLSKIKEFKLSYNDTTRHFIKGLFFNDSSNTFDGVVEILYKDPVKGTFISNPSIYIKKPTYNKALMVGDKDTKLYLKEKYFYVDTNNNIYPLKSKKDIKKNSYLSACTIRKFDRANLEYCLNNL